MFGGFGRRVESAKDDKHVEPEQPRLPGLLGSLGSWRSSASKPGPSAKRADYTPVKSVALPSAVVPQILTGFRYQALLIWSVFLVLVVAQWAVPWLEPNCSRGYSNATLIGVALVIGHHVYIESRAWNDVKSLLSLPELTVLRQMGVLQKRRRLVILGILEALSLYTDLSFPFTARSCDIVITGQWLQAWGRVPIVGAHVVSVLSQLRFWGVAGILVTFMALGAFTGVGRLMLTTSDRLCGCARHVKTSSHAVEEGSDTTDESRLPGEVFFSLARFAETATLPSVAQLCEGAGMQRRWMFSANANHGGAPGAAKARQDIAFGKLNRESLELYELYNEDERHRVDSAGNAHYMAQLVGKVLLANAAQLWLQSSFFELSFDWVGTEAQWKLIAGMIISGYAVLARSAGSASQLGCSGYAFLLVGVLVTAWAGAKVYYAFECDDHVWNLTTGCVTIHKVATTA